MTRRNKTGDLTLSGLSFHLHTKKWGEQRSDKQQTNETSRAFPLTLTRNTYENRNDSKFDQT